MQWLAVTWISCTEYTKISYQGPMGLWGAQHPEGFPGCQGPPGFIYSCCFNYSLLWLVQGTCLRIEWLSGCRVFMTNSWCWRLNGASWVGCDGSRKPIWCVEGTALFPPCPPPPKEFDSAAWGSWYGRWLVLLVMLKVSGFGKKCLQPRNQCTVSSFSLGGTARLWLIAFLMTQGICPF